MNCDIGNIAWLKSRNLEIWDKKNNERITGHGAEGYVERKYNGSSTVFMKVP